MRRNRLRLIAFVLVLPSFAFTARAADWPAWRGPHGNGVCDEADLPLHWSATQNVAW